MTASNPPILVPLDGSTTAESALPAAIELALLLDAPLDLVHAIDDARAAEAEVIDHARTAFEDYVEGLLNARGAADQPHMTDVVHGPAARTILDIAREARLVVIATHGRGGLKAALIGSVADKVVRGASVPVLAIPLGAPARSLAGRPLVVALDGSEAAETVLAEARALAGALHSRLMLVQAYTIPAPGVDFVAYPVDVSTTLREAAEAYLRDTARDGEDIEFTLGEAVDVVGSAADRVDAGIIVFASHGKGMALRIALGSTTMRALHRLQRPMLIVPPPHRASAGPTAGPV